jgi:putative ABC transport system permease protein
MLKLIKISWRNIWRNKLRSSVVIGSIILGVLASVFLMGFMQGMVEQRTNNFINSELAHIQIHPKDYRINFSPDNLILSKDQNIIENWLNKSSLVESYSKRANIESTIQSPRSTNRVRAIGINPNDEQLVTTLSEGIKRGSYFGKDTKRPIVISEKLAELLSVDTNKRVTLGFTNTNGDFVSARFKIVGIYKSSNSVFDQVNVFVLKSNVESMCDNDLSYEYLIKTKDISKVNDVKKEINNISANLYAETWADINIEIAMGHELISQFMGVFMLIIIVALLFGLINTLLMSILERKKEIGVLMAIGMNSFKIVLMIMFEAIIFGVIGGVIGMVIGYFLIYYFGIYGIDLSMLKEGLENFGMSTSVYTELEPNYYLQYGIMIFIATLIGSLYPAYMATKLNPMEATKSI